MMRFVPIHRRSAAATRLAAVLTAATFVASGCSWTIRASVDSNGTQGNAGSTEPVLSSDGSLVAFSSDASNLLAGDTNGSSDVFARDNTTGAVERVSVDSTGTEGDDDSYSPSMSEDGRYVAFDSLASNLVPGDTAGTADVFVHDRSTGMTERVATQPATSPALSADGRFVAFREPNQVSVHDRDTQTTETIPIPPPGFISGGVSLSDDGRYVTYGVAFVDPLFIASVIHDLQTGTSETIVGTLPGVIAGDARYFSYNQLVPITSDTFRWRAFVLDRDTDTSELVSVTSSETELVDFDGFAGQLSDDGRYVLFSGFGDYVTDDTNQSFDIYVRDRSAGNTFLAVRSGAGSIADFGSSTFADISDDGRHIAFAAPPGSSNLVPDDTNGAEDVFVRSFPQPAPLTATPATVAPGTTTSITIEGEYLLPSSHVAITGTGVSVGSVTWISDQELAVSITVAPDAATGPRSVLVSIPGTGGGPGAVGACSCLTIA